ncbi:MAG: hypothetical protein CMJ81_22615 [Planctomycetaceae bacterium]|nr:hypothetical protein [Planctomycetaceae bacterium]MBP62567.1 hypothetical protein [Planctomycetaceae bacterium]
MRGHSFIRFLENHRLVAVQSFVNCCAPLAATLFFCTCTLVSEAGKQEADGIRPAAARSDKGPPPLAPANKQQTAEQIDLAAVLGQPIINPTQTLSDVQDFTFVRVPPMPQANSVAEWEQIATRLRRDTLERIVFRGEASQWRDATTKVEWLTTIDGGPGYRIKKLRFEALPGLWIPALLYEPAHLSGKVPVVMNVNGHDRQLGKATPFKQLRCINLAKRGMLALNVEWFGMGQLYSKGYFHYRMNQLDLCGTSGVAPFYLSMVRGLDLLLSLEHADPQRVAVAGLSGGGWQTIFIGALDTRVTLANPVAGYSGFRTRARHPEDLGDPEQAPVDLAITADYLPLTAMLAPRPTLLTYCLIDHCCFRAEHALPPLMEAALPIFKLYGRQANLRSHVNVTPGNHNFGVDNREQFYRMLRDHFYDHDTNFETHEIPSEEEIKTPDTLHVDLPPNNADFNTLASTLSRDLPRHPELPKDHSTLKDWQLEKRKALQILAKIRNWEAHPIHVREQDFQGGQAKLRAFRVGEPWTVPVVELVRGQPRSTVILVADDGRQSVTALAKQLLDAEQRVLAIDPFYLGESKIPGRDYDFAVQISAVGERLLGVQSSQLVAVARWAKREFDGAPVRVVAHGPRCSLFSLVAAAIASAAIDGVELHGSMGSLKEVIEQNMSLHEAPELFCFGLLEEFDLCQLVALVAPRPVRFINASERVQREMAILNPCYDPQGITIQDFP